MSKSLLPHHSPVTDDDDEGPLAGSDDSGSVPFDGTVARDDLEDDIGLRATSTVPIFAKDRPRVP